MKNLLISKSFSYEIVDFTLLWQSNAYRLGGDRSIQLSYEDLVEKSAVKQINQQCHIHVRTYCVILSQTFPSGNLKIIRES